MFPVLLVVLIVLLVCALLTGRGTVLLAVAMFALAMLAGLFL